MIMTVIGWAGFAAVSVGTVIVFTIYLRARSISNKLLVSSSETFFDSCDSLFKTPDEIPDSVVEMIEMMNKSISSKRGHWALLRVLKARGNGPTIDVEQIKAFDRDVDGMRQELRDIFNRVVVSWLTYLAHQNVFTLMRIALTVMRVRSTGVGPKEAEETAGLSFLRRMEPC
ncbi:hypothetical protein [Roseovarius sp. 2305UL8-3]|uniref:hypothetical protein n=1 Tax=Roseovarius conchicola TaxID=3121636 RepID=UPI003528B704